jgi:hypothetical protein
MWKTVTQIKLLIATLVSLPSTVKAIEALVFAEPTKAGGAFISVVEVRKDYANFVNKAINVDEGLSVWNAVTDPFVDVPFSGDIWSLEALFRRHRRVRPRSNVQFKSSAEVFEWLFSRRANDLELAPAFRYDPHNGALNSKIYLMTQPFAICVRQRTNGSSFTTDRWHRLVVTLYNYLQVAERVEHGHTSSGNRKTLSLPECFTRMLKLRNLECHARFLPTINALWIESDGDLEKINDVIQTIINDNSLASLSGEPTVALIIPQFPANASATGKPRRHSPRSPG